MTVFLVFALAFVTVGALICVFWGIRHKKKSDEMKKDYLTHLFIRRTGEEAIKKHLKNGDGCLMIIDLDNFKEVNDQYGHLSGDYALKAVADTLQQYEKDAIICRVGGDEFLYFLKDVVRVTTAVTVVEDIISAYNCKCKEEELLKETSLSIGIALSSLEGRDYTNLFNCADKALYYVKKNGKCGYSFFDKDQQLPEPTNESSVDLARLVAAIQNKESYRGVFKVEYREFSRIYEFVEHYTKRNQQKIQLLMFTLMPEEKAKASVENTEKAMKCMEEAIATSLRSVDVSTRFSSQQYLVILVDTDKQGIVVVTERIIAKFNRLYGKNDMVLCYDVADLGEAE